jgi:hypothetical protein
MCSHGKAKIEEDPAKASNKHEHPPRLIRGHAVRIAQ